MVDHSKITTEELMKIAMLVEELDPIVRDKCHDLMMEIAHNRVQLQVDENEDMTDACMNAVSDVGNVVLQRILMGLLEKTTGF